MRGKNLRLGVEAVLDRATKLIGTGKYTLVSGKNGGDDPEAPDPYGPTKKADCIGVAMYIQGLDRFQEKEFLPDLKRWNKRKHGPVPDKAIYGGYINTNSILLPNVLFREVPENQVLPGDLVIWPSYKVPDGVTTRTVHGHALTVYSVYGTQNVATIEGQHKLRGATREAILPNITVVHCNARTVPATILGACRPPKQVVNTWRFLRPVWR